MVPTENTGDERRWKLKGGYRGEQEVDGEMDTNDGGRQQRQSEGIVWNGEK